MDAHGQENTTTGEPYDSGPPREQITEDRNAPITAVENQPIIAEHRAS